MGDLGLIPELGRSPGEGEGYPLQYSGLENSMDCVVHGVAKGRTRLRVFLTHTHTHTHTDTHTHGHTHRHTHTRTYTQLLYSVVFVSAVQQRESAISCICPLPLGFPSQLGHPRALSISLIVYFIHRINSVYMSTLVIDFVLAIP